MGPLEALGDGQVVPVEGPPPYCSVLVVPTGDGVRGYWNVCRHLPVPLDGGLGLMPRVDDDLVCSTHGAVFGVADGACTSGPCLGDALQPVELTVDDGVVYAVVKIPDVDLG